MQQPLCKVPDIATGFDRFAGYCRLNDAIDILYCDISYPVNTVIEKSRFEDLIVVFANRKKDAEHSKAKQFLNSLTISCECAVVVVPQDFHHVDEIIFFFDGTASAFFAIKQFCYLFPQLSGHSVLLLESGIIPEQHTIYLQQIVPWLRRHYKNVREQTLAGDSKEALSEYVSDHPFAILIAGTLGRSIVSFSYRQEADSVTQYDSIPVFISHR